MKQPTFRFWSRYSRQYLYQPSSKVTTTSLVTICVFVFFVVFGVIPQVGEIRSRGNSKMERESTLSLANNYLGKIKKSQEILKEATAGPKILEGFIPSNDKLPDLLEGISVISSRNGFQLTFLSPRGDKTKSAEAVYGLKKSEITIILEGDAKNLLSLVKDIEANQRYIGIKTIDLTNKSEGLSEVKLGINVYSFKE